MHCAVQLQQGLHYLELLMAKGNLTSTGACKCSDGERVSRNKSAYFKSRNNRQISPGLLGFLKWVFTNVICCKNNVCCHNLFSRFVDLSSMLTLTNLDLLGICVWHYSGNSIHHCSISHIQKGIGICFSVITA